MTRDSGNGARDGDDVVVARPRRTAWMGGVLGVALLAVFTVVAVLLRGSDSGAIFHLSDQIAMVFVGLLLGLACASFGTPKVRADSRGIDVRNVGITRHFDWDEVLSVSFPDGASFARLELPDDEYYPLLAVQAVDRHRAVEAVRGLRRLHRRAGQD
ncbi:PH domain-containing protein [Prauserella halophila]|nr:PH domain-containing protein [Prauserella halophila]